MHKLLHRDRVAARVEDATAPEEACEGTLIAEVSVFRQLQIPVEEAASSLA